MNHKWHTKKASKKEAGIAAFRDIYIPTLSYRHITFFSVHKNGICIALLQNPTQPWSYELKIRIDFFCIFYSLVSKLPFLFNRILNFILVYHSKKVMRLGYDHKLMLYERRFLKTVYDEYLTFSWLQLSGVSFLLSIQVNNHTNLDSSVTCFR